MKVFDVAVIGGGIVGLATVRSFLDRHPSLSILLIEKERGCGLHQTGHNSGVIHSGIYYKPGSLKARLCVDGRKRLTRFCGDHGIPFETCGKVIVATREEELPRLIDLKNRGEASGLQGVELIDRNQLNEIEPEATGIQALIVPETGIVNFLEVAQKLAETSREMGVSIANDCRLMRIKDVDGHLVLETTNGDFRCKHLVNCGGLFSDRIARLEGAPDDVRIIPFRGEYYFLSEEKRHLVRNLIYPVPDPSFPFLGVHLTRTIDGHIEAGPNAVLAFAREGYSKGNIDIGDLIEIFNFRGFWKMAVKSWKMGSAEMIRSFSKEAFASALRKLVPAIQSADLKRGGAGVRAQALSMNGQLLDDFSIVETSRSIHVRNSPSPGATASLAIGEEIVIMAERSFSIFN